MVSVCFYKCDIRSHSFCRVSTRTTSEAQICVLSIKMTNGSASLALSNSFMQSFLHSSMDYHLNPMIMSLSMYMSNNLIIRDSMDLTIICFVCASIFPSIRCCCCCVQASQLGSPESPKDHNWIRKSLSFAKVATISL